MIPEQNVIFNSLNILTLGPRVGGIIVKDVRTNISAKTPHILVVGSYNERIVITMYSFSIMGQKTK